MKLWSKGKFGFWIVGKHYMRKRDVVMGRLFSLQGQRIERERIIKIIEQWAQDDETNHVGLISLIEGKTE